MDRILTNRNIGKVDVDESDLLDPFDLHGMKEAVERVVQAIKGQERIMIYGDYDVDGTTASAILFQCLQKAGAKVSVRLPNRQTHGYGLNNHVIDECVRLNVKLIITVDTGTSAHAEANYAKEKGIDLLVTDHHSPPDELPNAFSIINPRLTNCNYHNKELCGTAVAWKLAMALFIKLDASATSTENWKLKIENSITKSENEEDTQSVTKLFPYQFIDLVALSTICDCMPLIGENRAIVSLGLKQFKQTKHPGMQALINACELDPQKIDVYHLGFVIGPCINAAGRLADPMLAFKMLTGDTSHAKILQEMNRERQELLKTSLEEAEELLEIENRKLKIENSTTPPLIFLYKTDWHLGIVGLIAGRLCEKYNLPTIICGGKINEKGQQNINETPSCQGGGTALRAGGEVGGATHFVGSCRSIPQINITDQLRKVPHLFESFGGHAQAAGFTITPNNIDVLKKELTNIIIEETKEKDLSKHINIDTEIDSQELSFENLTDINRLEPFGLGNPRPRFLLRNVKIKDMKKVGKTEDHLKMTISNQQSSIPSIAFNFGEHHETLSKTDTIDLVCTLEQNEWQGNTSLQLKVEDIETQ